MTEPRKRRIVRRMLAALAVPFLLIGWYVLSWMIISRAAQQETISADMAIRIAPAFAPIVQYCRAKMPGSQMLTETWWTLNPRRQPTMPDGTLWPEALNMVPGGMYPPEPNPPRPADTVGRLSSQ
ncbi:MAG: hypothetical protein JNG89_10190 [Planctomycetaceae bacterium]|nr:hypothetical protein [Planctomycetaceae bacterium]